MFKYANGFLFLLISSLLFNACKSREVLVPGYIHVKEPVFTVKSDASQGAASQDFQDFWIFENGLLRGNYATPCEIPIQRNGKTPITISVGIKRSGQEEERVIYPLVTSYKTDIELKPNTTDTIRPEFQYLNNTVFPFLENFDRNGVAFEYNPSFKQNGDTIIREKSTAAWDPNSYSGKVILKEDGSILEIYSQVFKDLPRFTPIYFEMDYKNNVKFTIGLYVTKSDGSVDQVPMFLAYESDSWKKLYLDLENEISPNPSGTMYRLFIRFSNNLNAPISDPQIYIDNLKLVHLD